MKVTLRGAWEVISASIVAVAAVIMLTFYLHDRQQGASPLEAAQTFANDWQDWEESGIRMGADGATMVVATFMDFQCPYCRDLVPVLDSLRSEFPGKVVIEHHHFLLKSHELAVPSAIAAECAARQRKFAEMYHTLFSQMDSIGSKAWGALAADAGVPDIPGFERCIQSPQDAFPRIAAGHALGASVGIRGTPSVWINGELFQEMRNLAAFRRKAEEMGLGEGSPLEPFYTRERGDRSVLPSDPEAASAGAVNRRIARSRIIGSGSITSG